MSQGVQAWDRFAYANNDPIKYNDPSGHCIDPDNCPPPPPPAIKSTCTGVKCGLLSGYANTTEPVSPNLEGYDYNAYGNYIAPMAGPKTATNPVIAGASLIQVFDDMAGPYVTPTKSTISASVHYTVGSDNMATFDSLEVENTTVDPISIDYYAPLSIRTSNSSLPGLGIEGLVPFKGGYISVSGGQTKGVNDPFQIKINFDGLGGMMISGRLWRPEYGPSNFNILLQ